MVSSTWSVTFNLQLSWDEPQGDRSWRPSHAPPVDQQGDWCPLKSRDWIQTWYRATGLPSHRSLALSWVSSFYLWELILEPVKKLPKKTIERERCTDPRNWVSIPKLSHWRHHMNDWCTHSHLSFGDTFFSTPGAFFLTPLRFLTPHSFFLTPFIVFLTSAIAFLTPPPPSPSPSGAGGR